MYTIETSIDTSAPLATVHAAVTTKDGFRGWWTKDTDCDADKQEATFTFVKQVGQIAVTFKLDRVDEHSIAMTCIRELNNPDWLGTKLVIELAPIATGTRVRLVHSGYPAQNECYAQCVKGWAFFMGSLAKYAATGVGEPHAQPAAA